MIPKIITLKMAHKVPVSAGVVMSGSFDPFGPYYQRLLRWAATLGNPLTVIVQRDKMVSLRRGFLKPSDNSMVRARKVAKIPFVDYVIVADLTAHDRRVIRELEPSVIAFQNDNQRYRKNLTQLIKKSFPQLQIAIAPFKKAPEKKRTNSAQTQSGRTRSVGATLREVSANSEGTLSRVSALLLNKKNEIILTCANSRKEEHAELLLIRQAKKKKIALAACVLCILIPPCTMCAEQIAKSGIRRVFYLLPYGDGEGVEHLRQRGIHVRQYGK